MPKHRLKWISLQIEQQQDTVIYRNKGKGYVPKMVLNQVMLWIQADKLITPGRFEDNVDGQCSQQQATK